MTVLPIGKSQVKELAYLKNFYNNLGASLRLVVDNIAQLEFLLTSSSNWSVMIKIDIEQDVATDGTFGSDFDTLMLYGSGMLLLVDLIVCKCFLRLASFSRVA